MIDYLIKHKFVQISVILATPALIGTLSSLWLQVGENETQLRNHKEVIALANMRSSDLELRIRSNKDNVITVNKMLEAIRDGFGVVTVSLARLEEVQGSMSSMIKDVSQDVREARNHKH